MPPQLEELVAQRNAYERAVAEHHVPLLQEAETLFASSGVTELVAAVTALSQQFPSGEIATQLNNIAVVLTAVPGYLSQQLAHQQAILNPPAPTPPQP